MEGWIAAAERHAMSAMRGAALVLSLGVSACGPPAGAVSPPGGAAGPTSGPCIVCECAHDVAAIERRVIAIFAAGDGRALFASLAPNMAGGTTPGRMSDFVQGVLAARGTWRTSERAAGETSAVEGTFRVHADRGSWDLWLVVDPEGKIRGLRVTDPPPPAPPIGHNDIPIGLPVTGTWTVVWGGSTEAVNHHVGHGSQERAADLVVTDENGKSFRTDGKTNEDYFAYGKPIVAVDGGTVVVAIEGVPENVPGSVDGTYLSGNTVIVQHEPKLFSVYGHLQPGSLRVRVGDIVHRGTVVGLCGNSGHSTEPHLHFQLQDSASFERSHGVEAIFADVELTRGGRTARTAGYTFLKGDRIAPP